MNEPAPATRPRPVPHSLPATPERVSELMGDRVCAACGFNLYGQTIVREPHYGLLIVRCPECGTAASLQEYPAMGRWGHRARFLLAAVYFAALLCGLAITIAVFVGFVGGTIEHVTSRYSATAAADYAAFLQSLQGPGPPNNMAMMNGSQAAQWWNSRPPTAYLYDHGGFWQVVNWWGLLNWIWAAIVVIPIGMVWGVVLPRGRFWTRLGLMALISLAAAATFAREYFLTNAPGSTSPVGLWSPVWGWWGVEPFARQQIGGPIAIISILACAGFAGLGMMWGRPVARLLIRALLPRSLRPAFHFLWTVDGRPFPTQS